jgi:L-ascorbate metabolism protein UlaG (beta-lactamase superfamily)
MTDPWIGVTPPGGSPRFSFGDLPTKIDYVLISHAHVDHVVFDTLLRLRPRVENLVVPRSHGLLHGDVSLKLVGKKLGFKNVLDLEVMEALKVPNGEIIATPFIGEHGDLAHGKSTYVLRRGKENIFIAVDSVCHDRRFYEHLVRDLGSIETVFIGTEPVGVPYPFVWGPLLPKRPPHKVAQGRRTNGSDAKAALAMLETVRASRVYLYAMALEPWCWVLVGPPSMPGEESRPVNEANTLVAEARGRGFQAAELLVGQATIQLP